MNQRLNQAEEQTRLLARKLQGMLRADGGLVLDATQAQGVIDVVYAAADVIGILAVLGRKR